MHNTHAVAKGSLYCVISLRPLLLDYVVHRRLQQKIRRQHTGPGVSFARGAFLCPHSIINCSDAYFKRGRRQNGRAPAFNQKSDLLTKEAGESTPPALLSLVPSSLTLQSAPWRQPTRAPSVSFFGSPNLARRGCCEEVICGLGRSASK